MRQDVVNACIIENLLISVLKGLDKLLKQPLSQYRKCELHYLLKLYTNELTYVRRFLNGDFHKPMLPDYSDIERQFRK